MAFSCLAFSTLSFDALGGMGSFMQTLAWNLSAAHMLFLSAPILLSGLKMSSVGLSSHVSAASSMVPHMVQTSLFDFLACVVFTLSCTSIPINLSRTGFPRRAETGFLCCDFPHRAHSNKPYRVATYATSNPESGLPPCTAQTFTTRVRECCLLTQLPFLTLFCKF